MGWDHSVGEFLALVSRCCLEESLVCLAITILIWITVLTTFRSLAQDINVMGCRGNRWLHFFPLLPPSFPISWENSHWTFDCCDFSPPPHSIDPLFLGPTPLSVNKCHIPRGTTSPPAPPRPTQPHPHPVEGQLWCPRPSLGCSSSTGNAVCFTAPALFYRHSRCDRGSAAQDGEPDDFTMPG